jgi:Flp pilus assembly protein TadB
VSKERAQRRAEREREAAVLAAAKAAEAERRERREARRQAVRSRLPRKRPGQSGVLAERRRTQTRLLVVAVIVLNVLVWLSTGDWAVRIGALALSLLVGPLVHILMTKN